MSSESLVVAPAKKPRPRARPALAPGLLDIVLVVAFLGLTFLLGAFPLKDTDFWWHLRTGDLIRQTGRVPHTDLYTYTVANHRWIDLHWGFQVVLSWAFARGGVVALNLAKCALTCVAILLLVTARRRDWPVWVSLLAWLPALLVLGGRMYIRPETLTLFYLALDLAILTRWERYPMLAWLLPLVQVAWVNSHGLFILGPIFIACALLDALFRPGALAPGRKRWWRTVALATLLTGLACLVNPYGVTGALFPLELARTMANPIFARNIAELTPIPLFIERSAGWHNLPLQLHLATMILGALSFVIPLTWSLATWFRRRRLDPPAKPVRKSRKAGMDFTERGWRLSPMRLLLFVTFSVLSWRATRNSHQFAAVVGAITAWNFAEWAAALARRSVTTAGLLPRIGTLGCIIVVFVLVASGRFYAWAGEGRTVGLGEEPLWFPHAAVEFAGEPNMPPRFLSFHDGYAALYEYHNGPDRKVFVDARLEVVGPELYQRYLTLSDRIRDDDPGWDRDLEAAEQPAVLVGHATDAVKGASILAHPGWRLVWFDPLVAVFVPRSYTTVVATHGVDLGARHFAHDPATDPHGLPALVASAEALWKYAQALQTRGRMGRARPLVLLGREYAGRIRQADPDGVDGWKLLGKLEMVREPIAIEGPPVRRYRLPFDPVHDLSALRATFELRRAHEVAPRDFLSLFLLCTLFEARGMDEAQVPLLERLARIVPINRDQARYVQGAESRRKQIEERLGKPAPTSFENLSELDQTLSTLLAHGRVRSAAEFLERAYPPERLPWEVSDRLGTLWLHLGEPVRARNAWEKALTPSPALVALRAARVAVTHLVEGDFEPARRRYREALATDPDLFEAYYGLAVLEQDAGRADAAMAAANAASAVAPDDVARSAVGAIRTLVRPYSAEGDPPQRVPGERPSKKEELILR
jgi:tetratricopeptide (TPR) repeat protein